MLLPAISLVLLLAHGGDTESLAARAIQLAKEALDTGPVAGLSIGIARGGETVFAKGFGFADLENEVPATEFTEYRIGSITKQFTAVAILKLREEGKLALEDPVSKFFPDYPGPGREATIHQLLNHTSGIKSYTSLGPVWHDSIPLDRTPAQIMSLFAKEPLDFPPGSAWTYNNSGYFLLGMIIEQVSGMSY